MPVPLTPEQQLQIAYMLQGNPAFGSFGTINPQLPYPQPPRSPGNPGAGVGYIPAPGRDAFKGPGSTTYYNPPEEIPQNPPDAWFRQAQLEHRIRMQRAVNRFGGDTRASRQAYRQDFFERRPLGIQGAGPSGYNAWVRKAMPIRPL